MPCVSGGGGVEAPGDKASPAVGTKCQRGEREYQMSAGTHSSIRLSADQLMHVRNLPKAGKEPFGKI